MKLRLEVREILRRQQRRNVFLDGLDRLPHLFHVNGCIVVLFVFLLVIVVVVIILTHLLITIIIAISTNHLLTLFFLLVSLR